MKYYMLNEYEGDRETATRMRYFVTNVGVPEKDYECANYRAALAAAVAHSDWVPINGFQRDLPEYNIAHASMDAVAVALNKVLNL